MNKFKKIMLGALSVLTLGLFFVAGTKVNAATENNTYNLDSCLSGFSNADSNITPSNNGIFQGFVGKLRKQDAGTYASDVDGINAYQYEFQLRDNGSGSNTSKSGFNIVLDLTATQTATLSFTVYSPSNKGFYVGSTNYALTAKTIRTETDIALTSGTYRVTGTGSVAILALSVVVAGEDTSTYYDLKYYDGSSYLGTNRVADGATGTAYEYDPAFYTFNGWKDEAGNAFDFTSEFSATDYSELIQEGTGDSNDYLNLYADLTAKPNALNKKEMSYIATTYGTGSGSTDAYTEAHTLTNSNFNLLKGVFAQDRNNRYTYKGESLVYAIRTAGVLGKSDDEVINGISYTASTAGYLTVATDSVSNGSDATFVLATLDNGTYRTVSVANAVSTYGSLTVVKLYIPEAGTYYFGGKDYSVYIFDAEFTATTLTKYSTEQQENTGGASIRYITTLSNVTNVDQIDSWYATFTLQGKKAPYTTTTSTALYTAVTGNNGKEAAANTYYLVFTLSNIPASFNTKVLTCKVTINMADGTTLESNIITHTVNVTA